MLQKFNETGPRGNIEITQRVNLFLERKIKKVPDGEVKLQDPDAARILWAEGYRRRGRLMLSCPLKKSFVS